MTAIDKFNQLTSTEEHESNVAFYQVTLGFIADIERIKASGAKLSTRTQQLHDKLIDDLLDLRKENKNG